MSEILVTAGSGKAKTVKVEECLCPPRVVVGHCPDCEGVIVVLNSAGVWPLVHCACGYISDLFGLRNRVLFTRHFERLVTDDAPEQTALGL